MSDRTRNEKGQYSTGQETPESEKEIPPPPETTGQTPAQNEKGPHQTTQSTAQIGVLHTETTGQTPAQNEKGPHQTTQSTAQIGVLHTETTGQTSPLSIGTADTRMEVQAALILASHEKSEVAIFLEGMIRQGIITRAHATYLLDMYPIEKRKDLSLITNMELRDTPEGLWRKGETPGPLTVKDTNLFLRSVVSYLHYDTESKVEVCDTNDDMGPQVLLLPTGKAVRFSPEMQQHAEDEARIQQEVEKRVELRAASMQASWLAQNQGQVGHHTQHGEALSKFPTRPDEERQREADRASMLETVVAGVVAGIEAQSQRTTTVSRSAANAAVQPRLTGSITSLLGDIPTTKGEGIDTDSLKWDTYLTAWIMAAGQLCALPDDPHGGYCL